MILWMPRLSRDGRYVVGFRPGQNGSAVVVYDRQTGAERVLDADGTQPVWLGDTIVVRPQSAGLATLRLYAADGSPAGEVGLPTPANWIEPAADLAAYLAPPPTPRLWTPALGAVEGYAGGVVLQARTLAIRHDTGALAELPSQRVVDPRSHDGIRAFAEATRYVARVYEDASRRWLLCVDGEAYPSLGQVHAPAGRHQFLCWVSDDGQLCVALADDPTRGWVVAQGDVRHPDLAVIDNRIVVVWCGGRGELGHATVDRTTPTVDLRVNAPPATLETWEPTAAEVDLWPLWTGSAGSQWPRRNPDDGGIYMDCQAVDLGDGRAIATYVKTADGRVWERRATGRDADGVAWIGLVEDHERDGRIYHFRDWRLMPRFAKAGDEWERKTEIREWDHARRDWGPWYPFRYRVRVASVERSSFGRTRAIVEVDTYQDLEIFELYSNKGWAAWEWWRGSAYAMAERKRETPIPVGFYQRTEWPERFDGPRPWPDPPKTAWPIVARDEPVPPQQATRITIVEPHEWPVIVPAGASLRVVYAVTQGPEPAFVEWLLDDEVVARNPGWDRDHTFGPRDLVSRHRIAVEAIDAEGKVIDYTARRREVIVEQAGPPPGDGFRVPPQWAVYGNFLANGIEPWGFMAPSWWVHDRPRWERFVRAYAAAGYRHLPFALYGAYRDERAYDLRGEPERARELVQAHLDRGVVPIIMAITDEPDGSTAAPDVAWARVRPALDAIRDLPVLWCTGWEINQIPGWREDRNPRQGHDLIALCRRIRDLTGKAPWVHFAPNWWGPHYEDGDEDRWWRDVGDDCCGLLGQIRPDAPLDLTGDPTAPDGLYLWLRYPRASDGVPGIVGRLAGRGKDVVLFEHSRDLARWRQVREVMTTEYVAGIC